AREYGDPEILARVAQYEMAYRMQSSVPELTDLSSESEKTFERYGPTRARRARSRSTAFSRGGWLSVESASSNSSTAAGISTEICRGTSPNRRRTPISLPPR